MLICSLFKYYWTWYKQEGRCQTDITNDHFNIFLAQCVMIQEKKCTDSIEMFIYFSARQSESKIKKEWLIVRYSSDNDPIAIDNGEKNWLIFIYSFIITIVASELGISWVFDHETLIWKCLAMISNCVYCQCIGVHASSLCMPITIHVFLQLS